MPKYSTLAVLPRTLKPEAPESGAYSLHCSNYSPNESNEICGRLRRVARDQKVGVLLAQLGTPDEPTPQALRRYLAQFLADPRVIEVDNKLGWWLIRNLIVLNTRPKRSARLYSRIWTPEGSPLLVTTKEQTRKLSAILTQDNIQVEFGMRYGSHSIADGLQKLERGGCSEVIFVPLYPHYCAATTGSSYDAFFDALKSARWVPTIQSVAPYGDHPGYIQVLSEHIQKELKKLPFQPDLLVFSYHGIPLRYVKNGDPYCCMCHETTRAVASKLGLAEHFYTTTFQSLFGRERWLEPYTDLHCSKLAKEGVKKIAVVCPGFSADCLETIDEIGHELRHSFTEAGGTDFSYLPALNAEDSWISFMASVIREKSGKMQVTHS